MISFRDPFLKGWCHLLVRLGLWGQAEAIVISEVHYNPPLGEEAFEFIELTNETDTPDDISGWRFVDGLDFEFPPNTILVGRTSIVVCADVEAFTERYGTVNAVGNFVGRLDSGGERLTLVDHAGIIRESLRYRDSGKWPVGPDGTGHTLALRGIHLDSGEPESWTQSPELGGTPGTPNFPPAEEPVFENSVLLDATAEWRFARGTAPFSDPLDVWQQPDFDDASWEVGASPFGFGDITEGTIFEDMEDNYPSVAIRTRFIVSQEELDAPGEFFLAVHYDDGFCAFLNGSGSVSANCPDEITHLSTVSRLHSAADEEFYFLDRNDLLPGENVLAIVGFNNRVTSNDFVLQPRVIRRVRIDEGGPLELPVCANELYRSAEEGGGWIELYNPSMETIELSGIHVTDDPDRTDPYVFADGSQVGPNAFLVLREDETGLVFSQPTVRLFLRRPGGAALHAVVFDREPREDLPIGSYSEALFPDGDHASGRHWITESSTPGDRNQVDVENRIVINELYYHPPEERVGEFLELYNRGTKAVDVSGFRFTKGIDCEIPENTTILPGGYLVLAKEPGHLAKHYGFDGALRYDNGELANGGENVRLVDRRGNLVDEVSYSDGGRWPVARLGRLGRWARRQPRARRSEAGQRLCRSVGRERRGREIPMGAVLLFGGVRSRGLGAASSSCGEGDLSTRRCPGRQHLGRGTREF